jgi:hypothetical protein
MSDASCHVYFRKGTVALAEAEAALRRTPLSVERADDGIVVFYRSGPRLRVTYEQQPSVRDEARELGADTEFSPALEAADARFVIGIDDLEEVLDETNTLIETQCALQDLTSGVMFNSWNGALSAAED